MVPLSRRPQSYPLSVETQFSPLLHVDANAKMDSCVQKQNIYTHTCGCHTNTHTHFFILHIICSGHYMHIKCYVQLYYCVTITGWLFQELSQLKIQQLLDSFFRLNCLLLYQWWTSSLKLWYHSWERSPEFEAKKNEILILKFLPGREWLFFSHCIKNFFVIKGMHYIVSVLYLKLCAVYFINLSLFLKHLDFSLII